MLTVELNDGVKQPVNCWSGNNTSVIYHTLRHDLRSLFTGIVGVATKQNEKLHFLLALTEILQNWPIIGGHMRGQSYRRGEEKKEKKKKKSLRAYFHSEPCASWGVGAPPGHKHRWLGVKRCELQTPLFLALLPTIEWLIHATSWHWNLLTKGSATREFLVGDPPKGGHAPGAKIRLPTKSDILYEEKSGRGPLCVSGVLLACFVCCAFFRLSKATFFFLVRWQFVMTCNMTEVQWSMFSQLN